VVASLLLIFRVLLPLFVPKASARMGLASSQLVQLSFAKLRVSLVLLSPFSLVDFAQKHSIF